MSREERLAKLVVIMNHYGFEKQAEMFIEECSEAIQAVQKFKRVRWDESSDCVDVKAAREHLCEEVADVLVMAEQMYNFLDTEEIERIRAEKINRQLERIREEEEDE